MQEMTPRRDRNFRNLGIEVVCLEARHARAALKMQINRTDQSQKLWRALSGLPARGSLVSSLAGIVLKLPRVTYPASASVLTGDPQPLAVGCERPLGLLSAFSGCRMWSVSSGS